jgi:hypothetical protein
VIVAPAYPAVNFTGIASQVFANGVRQLLDLHQSDGHCLGEHSIPVKLQPNHSIISVDIHKY